MPSFTLQIAVILVKLQLVLSAIFVTQYLR